MTSAITYHDQFLCVSNMRFFALIGFALEVGQSEAQSEAENGYVVGLREKADTFYPGYDLAIESEFPSRDERKFWARVFFDVAYLIFQRKLGNQDTSYSTVGDAYILARMLTRSVQEEELGWHPKTMESQEHETLSNNKFSVRI